MIVTANSIVQHVIQIKNGITKHVNVNLKIIVNAKKNYNCHPSTCICENSKYLKSIADNSVIKCDEIISAMDVESMKMTNTIPTNASINCHSEKVRCKIDCYILHTVLLAIILLLIIAIISYHYAKHRSEQKALMH